MSEEKRNGEIVPVEKSLSQRIADAEGGIEAINKLRLAALRLLKPRSVVDQQGHPYIKSNASSLIGRFFGVEVINQSWGPVEKIEHNDGFPDETIFTVNGTCVFEGKSFPITGVSSTRDKFFGKKTDKKTGEKIFKQYHEIDIPSLKMKAVTRMNGAAARAALDLNSLEWAELEAAGINKNGVESVSYMGGSGKKQDLSDAGKSALQEVKDLLNYCFMGVAADAKKWLYDETTFEVTDSDTGEKRKVQGKQDPNKLTEKQIPHVLTKLKKMKTQMDEAEANPGSAK